MSDAVLEAMARGYEDEERRWGYRHNKGIIDSPGVKRWQVYRDLEPDGPIGPDTIEIKADFPLKDMAEAACRSMRRLACHRAALRAAEAMGWKMVEETCAPVMIAAVYAHTSSVGEDVPMPFSDAWALMVRAAPSLGGDDASD